MGWSASIAGGWFYTEEGKDLSQGPGMRRGRALALQRMVLYRGGWGFEPGFVFGADVVRVV